MEKLTLMVLKSYLKYIVIYVSNVNDIGVLNSDPLISTLTVVTSLILL